MSYLWENLHHSRSSHEGADVPSLDERSLLPGAMGVKAGARGRSLRIACANCSQEFIRHLSEPRKRFCSRACHYAFRTNNPIRFWAKVLRQNAPPYCWNWIGSCYPDGYGQFKHNNANNRAPRFLYEQIFGPLPPGMWALHKCDNPQCVSPFHLFAGTAQDNSDDMVRKGRSLVGELNHIHKHPELVRGMNNGNATLAEGQILEIRKAHQSGATCRELAPRYNTTPENIRHIVTGRAWKHLL